MEQLALELATLHGALIRHNGGHWTTPNNPNPPPHLVVPPAPRVDTATVQRLAWRGALVVTRRGPAGLPVRVEIALTPDKPGKI